VLKRTLCAIQLALLCTACAGRHSSAPSGSPPASSPQPTATSCWIYDEMFPATKAAFESQHVSPAGRREIELFAAPSTPSRLRLAKSYSRFASLPTASQVPNVRWMRDGWARSLIIFVEGPRDAYWSVLNTNAVVDSEDCTVVPVPA